MTKKDEKEICLIKSEEDKRYEDLVNLAKLIIRDLKLREVTRSEKNVVFELIDEFSGDFRF